MVINTVRVWDSSTSVSRYEDVLLTRLRIGHCHLTHGHHLRGEPQPECDLCRVPLTVEHFLLRCRKYDGARRQYGIRPTVRDAVGNDFNSTNAVLRFLSNTGLDKEKNLEKSGWRLYSGKMSIMVAGGFQPIAHMTIHSAYEIPDVKSRYYGKGLGFIYKAYLKNIQVVSSPEVRDLPIKRRRCRYWDEPNESGLQLYSYNICKMNCRRKLAVHFCGCAPLFYGHMNFLNCSTGGSPKLLTLSTGVCELYSSDDGWLLERNPGQIFSGEDFRLGPLREPWGGCRSRSGIWTMLAVGTWKEKICDIKGLACLHRHVENVLEMKYKRGEPFSCDCMSMCESMTFVEVGEEAAGGRPFSFPLPPYFIFQVVSNVLPSLAPIYQRAIQCTSPGCSIRGLNSWDSYMTRNPQYSSRIIRAKECVEELLSS
ncbi:hypothetical protein ANN_27818 [Periplaneta americana]|uniref:Uncharacterized protein n=1 Tax=Periplaneta americana TaxID=6978 RepID=A0ABQ8RV87_PERAM|nr:hypothetical protein ANN_27818 [Periplaneta americana]